jgi:hypothetical protein
MKITITLTKGQLNQIAKQLASVDSEAVVEQELELEVATPAPAPKPEASPAPSKTVPAWQSKIARKADPKAYSEANKAANRAINAHVGQARKALSEGDEEALVEALKNAHGVCRSRVEAGAKSFALMADQLEGRIAR